jgi:hypothetical protein
MDVVGEAVHENDRPSTSQAGLDIPDIQHPGVDVLNWAEVCTRVRHCPGRVHRSLRAWLCLPRADHAELRSAGPKDRSTRTAQEPAAIWGDSSEPIALVHDCTSSPLVKP